MYYQVEVEGPFLQQTLNSNRADDLLEDRRRSSLPVDPGLLEDLPPSPRRPLVDQEETLESLVNLQDKTSLDRDKVIFLQTANGVNLGTLEALEGEELSVLALLHQLTRAGILSTESVRRFLLEQTEKEELSLELPEKPPSRIVTTTDNREFLRPRELLEEEEQDFLRGLPRLLYHHRGGLPHPRGDL